MNYQMADLQTTINVLKVLIPQKIRAFKDTAADEALLSQLSAELVNVLQVRQDIPA